MFASSLKQRSLKPERLDTGDYTPAEYAKWHREMRLLHGFFGEMRALRGSLLKELRNDDAERVSILDVGAGSGRLLGAIRQWSGNKKTFLVGAELSADAALLIKHNSINGEIQAIQSDALELPFADDSFDYVISTLFLHHLTDDQCVTLLGEIGRIARRKFFIIDLHRHAAAYYLYRIFSPLFLQRFTQEDGALSILKSFRPGELESLARRAGFDNITVERSAAYRLVLSGKKKKAQA